jgi:glycine/D-amino acid oxidase-like deaminating enzyme
VSAIERADAVVIGGGVMGTSIAFNLARHRFAGGYATSLAIRPSHSSCSM